MRRFRSLNRVRSVVLLIPLLVAASCERSKADEIGNVVVAEPPEAAPPARQLEPDLESQLRLWRSQRIANYDMTLDCTWGNGIGGPATPVEIRVSGNQARSIKATREIDTRPTEMYKKFDTVEKMFDYIQEIRDRSLNTDGARNAMPKVTAEFSSQGYPSNFRIDWEMAADAFTVCKVTNLSPLK